MAYNVHIQPNADGSLPIDKWQSIEADGPFDALVTALRLAPEGMQPEMAYVALRGEHSNGAPILVQGYSLKWGPKKKG